MPTPLVKFTLPYQLDRELPLLPFSLDLGYCVSLLIHEQNTFNTIHWPLVFKAVLVKHLDSSMFSQETLKEIIRALADAIYNCVYPVIERYGASLPPIPPLTNYLNYEYIDQIQTLHLYFINPRLIEHKPSAN